MIRRIGIVLLTLGAVTTMLLWAWSAGRTIYIMPAWWGSTWIITRSDGLDLWSGHPPEWKIRSSPLRMSIEHYSSTSPLGTTYRLPNVLPALMIGLAAYPSIAYIRGPLRRRRYGRKGLCLKCGYDLTGNTTGVCSECGEKL